MISRLICTRSQSARNSHSATVFRVSIDLAPSHLWYSQKHTYRIYLKFANLETPSVSENSAQFEFFEATSVIDKPPRRQSVLLSRKDSQIQTNQRTNQNLSRYCIVSPLPLNNKHASQRQRHTKLAINNNNNTLDRDSRTQQTRGIDNASPATRHIMCGFFLKLFQVNCFGFAPRLFSTSQRLVY